MAHVVIVNGRPRAGKDTFVELCRVALQAAGVPQDAYSSIEPVKRMLAESGIDISSKTDADRLLLSVMGDALEDHSNFRTHSCVTKILDHTRRYGPEASVFFLHIREPKNIKRVKYEVMQTSVGRARHVTFTTVLIKSEREDCIESNPSDAGVLGMDYDVTIRNDTTLDAFAECARTFLTERFGFPV